MRRRHAGLDDMLITRRNAGAGRTVIQEALTALEHTG